MDERERRRAYRHNAVLIDSDRVITPQFDDAVVYLTGAQLELLRNVSQYLNRRETYRAEKHPGYYLMPDDSDYDDILAIVADLEESLMGNPNTIWGYKDRLSAFESYVKSGDGDANLNIFTVPAGYVYVVQSALSRNADTAVRHHHRLYTGAAYYDIEFFDAQPANVYALFDKVSYVLKAGDVYALRFYACLDGDSLEGRAWGYTMQVPG